MDEFQGSFVSFINKPKIIIRPVPMKPEVIEMEEAAADQQEDGEEEVVEAGLYEVVPEENIEATGSGDEEPEKIVETPEMIYNRLHSELEQLAQACQDDFLYQITDEEYTVLSGTESNFLSQLNKLALGWCNKHLRIFRVCQGCDFRAAHAREINRHLTANETCKTYYYALGTFEAPANFMQCQNCNYGTNSRGNMRRHQQTRGHTGIDMPGNDASSSSSSVQQQELLQNEGFTIGTIAQQEVVQLDQEEEVVEAVPMQQVQVPATLPESTTTDQNQILADITMWPKDDDSGGHISNLQTRLEQQVENSDNHFIFRISDEEYAALCEQRAHHMAKFNELVNIYCNKTLKLYRVCDGCGFATFMRQDMIKHFETGTCPLSYFNALGTCDDDDPNREVEDDEAEEVAGFQITEATSGAIEMEPTDIEPEGVERYIQPKILQKDAIFKCPHCNKEMSIRNRSRHIKLNCPILSGKEKTPGPKKIPQNKQCWHCPKSFNTWVKLKHHIRLNHPETEPETLKCEDCQMPFTLLFHLNKHKREECPVMLTKLRKVFRPVKIQCQHCQIYFVEMSDLLRHQSRFCKAAVQKQTLESGQQMLLQCKDCLIICASATDLARHQKEFCRKRLESVIKVEPTRLGGGVELS